MVKQKGAEGGGGGGGGSAAANMHRLYNPEPWQPYRHLLPASPLPVLCIHTNICFLVRQNTHKKKKIQKGGPSQHLTGLRFAVAPARRLFTQKP